MPSFREKREGSDTVAKLCIPRECISKLGAQGRFLRPLQGSLAYLNQASLNSQLQQANNLNYLIHHKPVIAIPKAAKNSHIMENLGSMAFTINDAETELASSIRNTRHRKQSGSYQPLPKAYLHLGGSSTKIEEKHH